MKKAFYFLVFCFLCACSNDPTTQQTAIPLPNTPETVSKQWQLHLDNNEFEQVAALSSEKTKVWLATNKEIFLDDDQTYKTEFLKMDCTTNEDKAVCHCLMKDEIGEFFEDSFLLVNINGQWLVDIEEENASPDLEEQLFNELQRELNLSKDQE